MLYTGTNRQEKMKLAVIENLMPKDHLLRKIDRYIDFSFIIIFYRYAEYMTTNRNCITSICEKSTFLLENRYKTIKTGGLSPLQWHF